MKIYKTPAALISICCYDIVSMVSFRCMRSYVTWKRKRVRGSGSVWKRRSGIFKKIRKRIRVGSLPQDSDSDSGSEAGSGRPMKLPCNTDYRVLEQSTLHVLDTRRIDGYRKQRRRRYEGDRRSLLRL
ncbi:hypothetical protein YC2023_110262 [Brassica napus]